jgi:glycosyltransferase involved in cell wall biosynthesis
VALIKSHGMKVLHVMGRLMPSGMEVMLRIAAPYWGKTIREMHVLSTGADVGPYAETLSHAGYRIHHISFAKSLGFFHEYWKLLRREQYKVVHLHTERAVIYYGLLSWLAGVPCIVNTKHGVFQFKGALRWRRFAQRWLLRKIGVVHVSISPSVQNNEMEVFSNPTILVPNWYDSNNFYIPSQVQRQRARDTLDIKSNKTVVAVVGNCAPIKNHVSIFKAIHIVRKEFPELICLHAGYENKNASERKVVADLNLSDCVRFLGPQEDVARLFHAADLYVMCSLTEGLGIAAVEALACGLPAVLSDVPGLKDLRSIEGIAWTTTQYEDIAQSIRDQLSQPMKIHRSSVLVSAERVRQQYGNENGPLLYLKLYDSILQQKTGIKTSFDRKRKL